MSERTVKVVRKTQEAQDIISLELACTQGTPLPAFSAGAHIDVYIREDLIRQYSLLNDSVEQHRYVIGVLRDPNSRGGSVAIHDDVQEGDVLRISVPRNHFQLTPAPHSLLLAGGIGVTPLLCMVRRLSQIQASFQMHYCARSPARMAFLDDIKQASFADRVQLHFDDGEDAQKLDLPAVLAQAPANTHAYVCGPTGFIDYVTQTAKAAGWGSDRVHFEYFGAEPIDTSGDVPFQIKIASTGAVYDVPADKRIIDVLEAAGIFVPVSCQEGVCGTCLTRLLEGVPEHRDLYLTDDEHAANDQFTPCCSRAKSPMLVLDL